MPYQPSRRSMPPPSPTRVLPEYMLLQMFCNDLHLLDRMQHQITPEDFGDADLRAIYTTLLRLASQGERTVFPRILDEATSPRQTQLLSKMATETVHDNPAETTEALRDCLTRIRQRRFKEERQRIIERLRTVDDGSVEQQQLLQELDTLSKKQLIGSS